MGERAGALRQRNENREWGGDRWVDDGVEEHNRMAEGGYFLVYDRTERRSIEKLESLGSILM